MLKNRGNHSFGVACRALLATAVIAVGGVLGPATLVAAAARAEADAPPRAAPEAVRAARVGHWLRISLPIDDSTAQHVRQLVRRTLSGNQPGRPVFIFEFDIPADGPEFGHGTQFGDAYKLADFLAGGALNAATTVAYIPKSIKGHAVLAALACDEVVMAEGATIGEAGIDEEDGITPTLKSAYRDIASRHRHVPVEVALGLLDKGREVLLVRTDAGTDFVSSPGLEELKKDHPIQSQEVWKAAGAPGQFSAAEGRKLGFVSALAADRREVARALELSFSAAEAGAAPGGQWHAISVEIKGPMTAEKATQAERSIKEQIGHGVNFICLWLDTQGGSPVDSLELANYLAALDPGAVRTVAYIPREARGDAALIALACDQIVMHPRAVLGGDGAHAMTMEEIAGGKQVVRDELAPRKMRSWSLWAAMVDPQLEIFCCTRLGDVEYFCDEELAREQPKPRAGQAPLPWVKGERIHAAGGTLRLRGDKAAEYRLASQVVDSFLQFKKFYGLENDPSLIEPGWADVLIDALRSQAVGILLLVIGGAALYVELHAPGTGIGGFVAAICFLLFFWGRFLGGTAGWLEVSLFLTGIVCLLLEIFVVPGSGILGLGGGALVLVSLVLASQTFVWPRNEYQYAQMQQSLLTVAGAAAGLIGAVVMLRRWLPRAPVLGHLFLQPPEGAEAETIQRREMLVDLHALAGAHGMTTTPLGPGGKARFGNTLVDVMAEGEFIPRNSPVVVVEVHGNRVVVRSSG
ncbi:MAG: NfeD family protein [Thermoguttaceae bacterium]|jgi:membrane-bound ClpP family serine protease